MAYVVAQAQADSDVGTGDPVSVDLYTVPASTEAVISTLAVAEHGGVTTRYRVWVRPNGAAAADEHILVYNVPVGQFDTTFITAGIALAAGDVVTVEADEDEVTFTAFVNETAV